MSIDKEGRFDRCCGGSNADCGGTQDDVVSPGDQKARNAVRTLLNWVGHDNPTDKTPARMVDSWKELFRGYTQDAGAVLSSSLQKASGIASSPDYVLLKGLDFCSFCEHHIAPMEGKAYIAYMPGTYIVGLSKIARCLEIYSKRLQLQERLTQQVADAMMNNLQAEGVVVYTEATHGCMAYRGVQQRSTSTVCVCRLGTYKRSDYYQEFLLSIK